MQTGSSGTLIGWKSGQTTYFPLWDRMEGAWLSTLISVYSIYSVRRFELAFAKRDKKQTMIDLQGIRDKLIEYPVMSLHKVFKTVGSAVSIISMMNNDST